MFGHFDGSFLTISPIDPTLFQSALIRSIRPIRVYVSVKIRYHPSLVSRGWGRGGDCEMIMKRWAGEGKGEVGE